MLAVKNLAARPVVNPDEVTVMSAVSNAALLIDTAEVAAWVAASLTKKPLAELYPIVGATLIETGK